MPSPSVSLARKSPVTVVTELVVAPSDTEAVSAAATGKSSVPVMVILRDWVEVSPSLSRSV